jgi:RHS repeat-associated protein
LRNESEKEVLFDELNVRVYGTEKAVIIQENHYEPFGMTLKGLDYVVNEKHKNNFLFGGKELTEDLGLEGYDFVNRGYDPQKGSFNQIDPLADKMRRYSPYVYCFDNPMRYVDPDGMEPEDVSDDRKTRRYQRRQNKFNEKIKAFQEKLNTISQSVVNGELDQAGLDDAVKSLNKDFSKLNKAYKKLNASKVQGKILTPINQSLKIAGGFDKAYSNGNNTIGLNPASGNTQSSSYAYLSNLTNDKGQAVTLNQNSTVLSTTLTVNIEMQGQANISIFGATSMPVGGGLTGVNSLVNRVQNGSSSDTFSNAAPATPANTVGLTNPNSLAGFGVTANPVNNSQATGNININLQVNYFTPLRVEGYTH